MPVSINRGIQTHPPEGTGDRQVGEGKTRHSFLEGVGMEPAFRREGLEGWGEVLGTPSGCPTRIPCSGWGQAPEAKKKPGKTPEKSG